MSKNDLPKIFLNGQEIEEIKIGLGNLAFDYEIFINPFYDKEVSMTPEGVHLVYRDLTGKIKHGDEEEEDEDKTITYWHIEDKEDKITIDRNDTSIAIKWLDKDDRVKQSLFVPMEKIFHILTGKPDEEDIST